MRLIFNCKEESLPAAQKVAEKEMKTDWRQRYSKPGWGWNFNQDGKRFFVRGIKDGLSVTEVSYD